MNIEQTFLVTHEGEKDDDISTITNLCMLRGMWTDADFCSQRERLIEEREAMVLRDIVLPHTTDLDLLEDLLWNVRGSLSKRLIENRMAEIVRRVTDWDTLEEMWHNAKRGGHSERLIEEQIAAVYGEALFALSSEQTPPLIESLMEEYSKEGNWPRYLDRELLVRRLKEVAGE